MAFDSHSLDKFMVRLPDGMRDQVAATAAADERSMNGLIVIAIREYLDRGKKANALLDALVLAAEVKESVAADEPGPAFDIDEHVRMAADARRYRRLRDRDCVDDPDADLLVVRGDTWFSGEELDREIDTALRLDALTAVQQKVDQRQQP